MNYWFVQWTENEFREFSKQSNFLMDCLGHNAPNFKKKASRGDIVWIHSIISGSHCLLGAMKLDVLLDRGETEEEIQRSLATVKYEEYWVNQWDWIPMKQVDMGDLPMELNFFPLNRLPEGYKSGQYLRTPRILSPLDHNRLLQFWNEHSGGAS